MTVDFPAIEKILQDRIFPDLEHGRKNFDLLHTQAVVTWTKRLIDQIAPAEVDPLVMVTAAYAHDWGYYRLFEGIDHRSIEIVHNMKPLHMERGAKMIHHFLFEKASSFFSPDQIERVSHLVKVHDLVEQVQAEDEVLIMEADTLGMLDTDLCKPTFSAADNEVFLNREILNRRFLNFKHTFAKDQGKIVFEKRLHYYGQHI